MNENVILKNGGKVVFFFIQTVFIGNNEIIGYNLFSLWNFLKWGFDQTL